MRSRRTSFRDRRLSSSRTDRLSPYQESAFVSRSSTAVSPESAAGSPQVTIALRRLTVAGRPPVFVLRRSRVHDRRWMAVPDRYAGPLAARRLSPWLGAPVWRGRAPVAPAAPPTPAAAPAGAAPRSGSTESHGAPSRHPG